MKDKLKLSVRNFRAIEQADILLNGVTVVSGINGCGKSTLSKLLYGVFRTVETFEKAVTKEWYYNLEWVFRLMRNISSENRRAFIPPLRAGVGLEEMAESLRRGFALVRQEIENQKAESLVRDKIIEIFPKTANINLETLSLENLLDKILVEIDKQTENSKLRLRNRDLSILFAELSQLFEENLPFENCDLYELDNPIFNRQNNSMVEPLLITKAIYIDTPMIVGYNNTFENRLPLEYWRHLNSLLCSKRGDRVQSDELIEWITQEILHGEITVKKDISRDLVFTPEGADKGYKLQDCATGVKSIASLLLLLKNGHLDDTTLLIIDEPEVHLHPEWIVEYARFLVLMNKKIGVKLFIASHDPDMIAAIAGIAEKEEIQQNVNFYLASPNESVPPRYFYTGLKMKTGPIFKSFNKSIIKIEQYSSDGIDDDE